MQPSLFKNWKQRCSSLGKLLTNEIKISDKQLQEIKNLANERDSGININGRKITFTPVKKEKLAYLISLRDAPDQLPDGAKTHLDTVFYDVFWKRRRIISNNKMEKGTDCEPDSLQLTSDIDEVYYAENKKQFENNFLTGEPDNFQTNIKEIKSNYDWESFKKASLTTIYKWQVRGYAWLLKIKDGEIIYCLVNNSIKDLEQAIYYLKNKHDIIDEPTPKFTKEAQQIERNMIFDIDKWNIDYPNYQWHNTIFEFDIPKEMRIKRFKIDLLPEHISFMEKRIEMGRKYLIEKEKEELETIKSLNIKSYHKQIQIIKERLKPPKNDISNQINVRHNTKVQSFGGRDSGAN